MKLVVITRGRVGRLHTPISIPTELHDKTYILCPPDEVEEHKKRHPTLTVLAEGVAPLDYSTKFHNIVNGHYPELGRRILILDDDLRFSMRDPFSDSLIKSNEEARIKGFAAIAQLLETYPLVGLHPRAMGNQAPHGVKECTRINAMQGVNLDLIGPVKLNYWPILADMVLNLTLLTRGQKTAVWCNLFWDQVGQSNAPGGCSLHRTAEQQAEAVHGLAAMFPEFVRVKNKVQESGGGFWANRVDFTVQWQRAYKAGVQSGR